MSHDVLPHHDGVIDQQTHTQGQSHQRDHVDGEPEQVHEQKSANEGDRQCESGDDGGAPGIQKQKNNQDGEQCALNEGATHVFNCHANLPRTIGDLLQSHARWQLLLHVSQRFLQTIDHADGVLILRLLHREQQGALSVVECQVFCFLCTVHYTGKLTHINRSTIFAGDDHLAKVLRALHARFNLHHALLFARADGAHRQVLVFIANGRYHLIRRDAKGF